MNISGANAQSLVTELSKAVLTMGIAEPGRFEFKLTGNIPVVVIAELDNYLWGRTSCEVYIRPKPEFNPLEELAPKKQAQASAWLWIGPIAGNVSCAILHIGNNFAREWAAVCR